MNKRKLLFLFLCMTSLLLMPGTSSLHAQKIALEWAKNFGGKTSESGYALVVDAEGNVYTTGLFRGTADFDPGSGIYNLEAKGTMDAFVAKYNAAGGFLWARQFGGNSTNFMAIELGSAIAIDPSGNVLIAGHFQDTADFDPGPGVSTLISKGSQFDPFILKLDTGGNFVWVKGIDCTSSSFSSPRANGITTDTAGNVYITGSFEGFADFDPGTGIFNLSHPTGDAYVLKLSADGVFVWASQFMAPNGWGSGSDLVVDPEGNVYVSGAKLIVAPSTAIGWSGAGLGVFVWKLDKSGNTDWVYEFDDDADPGDKVTSIALDQTGNVYVCGAFTENVDCDPGPGVIPLKATGDQDLLIMKLSNDGKFIWVKGLGSSFYNEASSMAMDAANNMYITGYFGTTMDFDPGSGTHNLTANGDMDIFVLKLDSAAHFIWVEQMGAESSSFDWGLGIDVDAHGSVYTIGEFGEFLNGAVANFDPGPGTTNLTALGNSDVFIQKLVCNDTTAATLTQTACESFTLNGETYTQSGTYIQRKPNRAGCDSIITLHLTIPILEPLINVNKFSLSTTLPFTTYQWYLNGVLIPGATQSTYTVLVNGNYTVVVTNADGCSGTSPVYEVTNVNGVNEFPLLAQQIKIYPNPANHQVTIENKSGARLRRVSIVNMLGAEVYQTNAGNEEQPILNISHLPTAIYILRLETEKGLVMHKLEIRH